MFHGRLLSLTISNMECTICNVFYLGPNCFKSLTILPSEIKIFFIQFDSVPIVMYKYGVLLLKAMCRY